MGDVGKYSSLHMPLRTSTHSLTHTTIHWDTFHPTCYLVHLRSEPALPVATEVFQNHIEVISGRK